MKRGAVGSGAEREHWRAPGTDFSSLGVLFGLVALAACFGGCGAGEPADTKGLAAGSGGEGLERAIFAIPDPAERAFVFSTRLRSLPRAAYPEAARLLYEQDDEWAPYEVRLFVWSWSALDREEAFRAALEWAPRMREGAVYAATRAWAREDPERAALAVQGQVEEATPALLSSLTRGLAHGWAESGDPDGALDFVRTRFESVTHRESLIEILAQQMIATRGLSLSFRWAEALAEREDDRALLSIVFRKLARHAILTDPEPTIEWLTTFEGDPLYMERARRAAAVTWGQVDPASALAWAETGQAIGDDRLVGAHGRILEDWALRDEPAVRRWLAEAPSSARLDASLSDLALLVAKRRSPEHALEWAQYVADPATRNTLLSRIAQIAWSQDPAAARARLGDAVPEAVWSELEAARGGS